MVNVVPPTNSLVKYNTAILVSTSVDGKRKPKQRTLPQLEKTQSTRTEDYLNSILPPREYTENGQLWVQYVSSTPATRVDVINLQEELDKRLQQRQARETGICPIREELYAQCFDELIRQITIQVAERGFLLVRVRDELRMTIQAYQTLYESSIAFGMRKALQAEQRKAEMNMKIKQLESQCYELQKEVEDLEGKIEEMERREEEERERQEKAHKDEVEYLKSINQELKNELESRLTQPKK